MESVNDVLTVFDRVGQRQLGTVDLNSFYGYAPQIDRTTGLQGPFPTDPSCLFDPATQRWFQVVLTLDVVPETGDFTGRNTIDIAVSKTADPVGEWTIYHLPVQDDGTEGTPEHGCAPDPDLDYTPAHPNACIGDYPHIGADANGFYVTTNEYPFFPAEGYHAAQVYAFSKRALAAGASTLSVTQIDTAGSDRGNPGFTLWPAVSRGREYATDAGGTEYFLSSNAAEEANGTGSSRDLLVWALRNTRSLSSGSPAVSLEHADLRVGRYGTPPRSNQKPGDFPLGQCIDDTTLTSPLWEGSGCWRALFLDEPAHDETEYALDSNDTRMQQVVYADGRLWGALDTALEVRHEPRAGIEYFVVTPSGRRGAPTLYGQGYLGVAANNVSYPAIGVLPDGRAVMAFTLVGDGHYPSAAYAEIGATGGAGAVRVAQEGAGPADGFSGYKAFGDPPRPRWGDYGAAAMDGDSVWIASEYIGQRCTLAQYVTDTPESPFGSCGRTRTAVANWYTRISRVR